MNLKRPLPILLLVLSATSAGLGQLSQEVPPQEMINRARDRTRIYLATFKNLLSEEKKTFEIYEKGGKVKKRKVVDSTFLVYQLTKAEGRVAEFRNVVAVDGKKVSNADDRAKDFFEKVVAADNSQKEYERIRDESSRFDEDFAINGLTLFQAIALSDELRGRFRFTMAGRESIGGKNVYVVLFEQIRADPAITVNSPAGSNNYDIEIEGPTRVELSTRIRGRLWLDADTFNVRRELRERTIQPEGFPQAVVVAEDLLEYTDTDFGILVPSTLSHLQYRVRLKEREVTKDTRIVFEYGKFTQPDVDVKGEVKDKPE
ncbi:MAG: hypothetical protein ABIR33_16900 [Pyrinomonadaceae bacterium]